MQQNALLEWDNYYVGVTGEHSRVVMGAGSADWEILSAKVKPLLQQKKLIEAYWLVGQYMVVEEQYGRLKPSYGTGMLWKLSTEMTREFGSGFSERNLLNMRMLYIFFQIPQTLFNNRLTWSHYTELLKCRTMDELYFYKQHAENGNWSVRHLKQQMGASLYYTLYIYGSGIEDKVTL